MNIAVVGADALKAELKGIDDDVSALMKRAARLHLRTIEYVEGMGHDIAQIGEALSYFGLVHAGLGQTAKALQGLHATAHEAEKRLSPTEERSGPGDKTPPPKP